MVRTSLNTPLRRRIIGPDRLSNIPDHLLCCILSELSTKDSVRTSVLSKRWRNVWSSVPALDLDFHDFQADDFIKDVFQEDDDFDMSDFIDGFLEFNKELDLKRFKMIYDVPCEHCHDDFVWRLDQVVKRRVCHLTVLNRVDLDETLVRMPLSLYSCATLVDLTLHGVVFDNPESDSVSLPCVKTMFFEAVKFDGDSVLETIISSSPVLEDLTVITYPDDYLDVVCVRSQSLKRFKLDSQRSECYDADVEIDAPRLEYMSITGYQSESFLIHSIGPKVVIDVDFDVDYDDPSEVTMIRDFLIGISTAREMAISGRTLQVIHDYSEVEELPEFSNLDHLDALLVESSWEVLPTFLGCCMNLHSLYVELDRIPEKEEIKLSPVPQCVLSSLISLLLRTPKTPSKMRVAWHFMKKGTALKEVLFM